jgi:hypothetical protein
LKIILFSKIFFFPEKKTHPVLKNNDRYPLKVFSFFFEGLHDILGRRSGEEYKGDGCIS